MLHIENGIQSAQILHTFFAVSLFYLQSHQFHRVVIVIAILCYYLVVVHVLQVVLVLVDDSCHKLFYSVTHFTINVYVVVVWLVVTCQSIKHVVRLCIAYCWARSIVPALAILLPAPLQRFQCMSTVRFHWYDSIICCSSTMNMRPSSTSINSTSSYSS